MPKSIGTPVRCPSCRHPNLAIDIWCERCGTPLDWKKNDASMAATPRSAAIFQAPPAPDPPPVKTGSGPDKTAARLYCWSCGAANPAGDRFCHSCGATLGGRAPARPSIHSRRARQRGGFTFPKLALPALTLPQLALPRWHAPRLRLSRFKLPTIGAAQAPRVTVIVGAVIVLLLIVPLAYVLFPTHGTAAGRAGLSAHLTATSGTPLKAGSPQAVAAAGVATKTGLKYSGSCKGTAACLAITGQTMGQNAAAIVFSTAASGGRECVGYVVQNHGSWQLVDANCGLPGQVTPMVGRDAAVHVPGNCANVRGNAGLQGTVVTCLSNGSPVQVDGGPTFADGLIWWHTAKGWIAHTFLVSP